MTDRLTKCSACDGRGYHRCYCWPADCICANGDEPCEECGGDGFIDPALEQGFYWGEDDRSPSPQARGTTP